MFALLHNLYKYIKSKAERRMCLIILGVDNAGKTTLLNSLQGQLEIEATPTFGFANTSTTSRALGLDGRRFSLDVFDLGGGRNIRRVWKSYLAEVHGVAFVVDAADPARFDECKQVLHETLANVQLHGKPILVFANKQDLPDAATAADVAHRLGLSELTQNAYHILACTAKTPPGEPVDPRLQQGMNWLLHAVDEVYHHLHVKVEEDTRIAKEEEARKKAEREERVRKQREERARLAAEAAALEQPNAAGFKSGQCQHLNELSTLPGAVESPRAAGGDKDGFSIPAGAPHCNDDGHSAAETLSTKASSMGHNGRNANPETTTSNCQIHQERPISRLHQSSVEYVMDPDSHQQSASLSRQASLRAVAPSTFSQRPSSGGMDRIDNTSVNAPPALLRAVPRTVGFASGGGTAPGNAAGSLTTPVTVLQLPPSRPGSRGGSRPSSAHAAGKGANVVHPVKHAGYTAEGGLDSPPLPPNLPTALPGIPPPPHVLLGPGIHRSSRDQSDPGSKIKIFEANANMQISQEQSMELVSKPSFSRQNKVMPVLE